MQEKKNVQYLTKFSLNTTLPLGKQIQIDEPELLMQASGFFTPFLRSEKQENFTFLPIWQNAGLFLLASLSKPQHRNSQSEFKVLNISAVLHLVLVILTSEAKII